MGENQQLKSENSNRIDPVYNSGLNTANKRAVSVPLNVSIDNTKHEHKLYPEPISFYGRLNKYAIHKGISQQDVVRFALSMFLDKVGY